ncbi:MATE family efflux transporter [Exiguobacterium sp. AM39-5BH]|uniref:MATE family efflux transporter n=1 Tax=Exiguobacterium sp. AM39-5BH TaxID=2292355 RepID=UPI000FE195D2|nr:MATE family efflux transporter [Exiguobacterium sp. AM39-5BH]RHB48398.1 MATE family efflux transporter [Exiguobacterium sp. AM39-5BH]
MYQTHSLNEKIKLFFTIFFPILVTQVSFYLISFFDTVMSGRAGAVDLAGVGVGSSLWMPVYTGLSGILLAVAPIVAQALGARNIQQIQRTLYQGVYLAIGLSIATLILGFFLVPPAVDGMGLSDEGKRIAKGYLLALGFGVLPMFLFNVLRTLMDSLGKTRISMLLILLGLPINVGLNYIFIFGKFGVPAYGGVGAGIASAITYWLLFLMAFAFVRNGKPFLEYRFLRSVERIFWPRQKELLKLGTPIGLAIFAEVSIFAAVTLLLSAYGDNIVAAHQAAINFASFVYMLPLSASSALTIVVGYELGARRLQDAVRYAKIGIVLCLAVSLFSGGLLFWQNERVAAIYTNDAAVVELAAHFMIFAVFFQLSDAVAAPIQGILRGFKDVNVTLILSLIAYWVIGLPLGYALAEQFGFGPDGYWIGLIAGLAAGAVLLVMRLIHIIKRYEAQPITNETS